MDCTILAEFRHSLYTTCFTKARDSLFDLADALLTDTQARSFVELSQAACFERAWPSLYEALEDGRMSERPCSACSPTICRLRWLVPGWCWAWM